MSNTIVREFSEDRLNDIGNSLGLLDTEEDWGTTPKPQDVYAGFQAHQEVLEVERDMCRAYTDIEAMLIASYRGNITVCEDV